MYLYLLGAFLMRFCDAPWKHIEEGGTQSHFAGLCQRTAADGRAPADFVYVPFP